MRPVRHKRKPKAEMNVVPYIDVMLVLLVIFMVTAPMLTQGIQIELPKVAAEALPSDDTQSIVTLSVEADGTFHWNQGETVDTERYSHSADNLQDMSARVASLVADNPDTQVFIRADSQAGYGLVVAGMAALQQSGVAQLGLITEAP
ncbi:protein TolR [Halopseudomonas pelagia]|uniref:protein TolR n=1 Tax=Halopseudomonas pelagia TaxID=553151 RepID=UPI0003A1E1B7|nr:protein TolR [Halopseudomonas pelagia]|tara:strand:+ start:117345 stop:117785 length:441 start_codon:yes stop_codon:yes gene_type:complete